MHKIKKIQKWMKDNHKNIFIINRTDEFLSEYIAPYAERLNWISDFTGSAGRAIIEQNRAFLFVDGRYTVQANKQVNKAFYKIKHLNDYWQFLEGYKKFNQKIILDESLHSISEIKKLKKIFKNSNILIEFINDNPIDLHWKNQPVKPNSMAFNHKIKYSGEESLAKITRIQKLIKSKCVDYYFLNSLESIAWLLNIRGNDIENTPLIFCFVVVPKQGNVLLFIDNIKIAKIFKTINKSVIFKNLDDIKYFIGTIDHQKKIGMDENFTPFFYKNLCVKNNIKTKNIEDPCLHLKAIKNKVELKGARNANLRDGISITKFLYWLKNKMKITNTSELTASKYLLNLRKNNNLFHSLSFDTISAFGSHSALPHYSVTKKSNLSFKNNNIYLVDSGAQYKDGTTDITRTIIIGKPSKEHKNHFTRVLKGHIAVAQAIFLHNTPGYKIDKLARKSLQEINLDYDHGTGHGIGSFLSVHEGPQRISKAVSKKGTGIKDGMIMSNEPGYYKFGKYGIRIENLIVSFKKKPNLLAFDTISWAPIDQDLIDISLLNLKEINWLNNYHASVYKKISSHLNLKERKWLKLVTKHIKNY